MRKKPKPPDEGGAAPGSMWPAARLWFVVGAGYARRCVGGLLRLFGAAATRFFAALLGAEPLYDLGPYRVDRGNWMADNIGVHPRAVLSMQRLLQLQHGPQEVQL